MGRIDRELQRLIASGNKITTADMKALQANNRLLDAELTLPYLLAAYDHATAAGAWSNLATLAGDARVAEAITRLRGWNYSTPTGIAQGFDPGDNPAALPAPGQSEIDASVAASVFSMWRGYAVRNTIYATLSKVGLGNYLPGSRDAQAGLKFMLDNFDALGGKGASGLNFFAASGAPDAHSARDYVLLKSLKDALDRLASDELAPAFGKSANLADYRWGKLHRIVFEHPLGGVAPVFNLPGPNPYGFSDLAPNLKGVARSGGFESVDAASHSASATGLNDFMFGSGPARRFVGEMTTPIAASEILPGGESGVLGSPLYASQLSRWLTNAYHPLPVPAAAVVTASRVDFVP
ncbi:MAG TPA: penicillin acylase family protein, partial [Rhodanobacteraceae bacterium]|nr:penicillin acylase family protein [Rhodanobacteraceae bacterium]